MTHFLRTSVATLAAATFALAAPLTASAAPAGPSSVDTTVTQLQQQGFGVIVNRFGDLQAEQCTIAAVRPGQTYSRTDTGSGEPGSAEDLVTRVTDKTVCVDLSC